MPVNMNNHNYDCPRHLPGLWILFVWWRALNYSAAEDALSNRLEELSRHGCMDALTV